MKQSDTTEVNAGLSYGQAAHWARVYADELEIAGWSEDAAHFRRMAKQLEVGPPRSPVFPSRMAAAEFLIRHGRSWLSLTDEDVERGARAVESDPTYRDEIVRVAHRRAVEAGPPSAVGLVAAARSVLEQPILRDSTEAHRARA